MAKRDKDRDTSRRSEGGLRNTESVRRLSDGFTRELRGDPLDAIGGGFYRPDLSAFETVDRVSNRRVDEIVNAPPPRVSAGSPGRIASSYLAQQSKRAAERARETPASGRAPINTAPPALLQNRPLAKRASPVVTHEVRTARVERAHATCKERPRSNKPRKGGGSGKTFVPWCSRKR